MRLRRIAGAGIKPGALLDGPVLLEAGGPEIARRATALLDALAERPHVFNLGHGIGQHTPIEHVEQLLGVVRSWRSC